MMTTQDFSNIAYNMDCLEAMKQMKDNEFDLAIVDPPYGINASKQNISIRKDKRRKNQFVKASHFKSKEWDKEPPKQQYFTELFRVSKNQIICGGNYFELPLTNSWIIWNKLQSLETRSDGEMIWTSFNKPLKILPLKQDGYKKAKSIGYNAEIIYNEPFSGNQTIHPTQKPVLLYKWLLTNYAKPEDKILDTHLGSGSSRIACYDLGFDFVGYELDKEYFELQEKRFQRHINQIGMF